MKKVLGLIVAVTLISAGFASWKLQVQATGSGVGYGLGYEFAGIPWVAKLGIEGQANSLGSFSQKESFTDDNTGLLVNADATLTQKATRYGLFIPLNAPGLSMTPFIGWFFKPTLHFGAQQWNFNLDGTAKMPGADLTLGVDESITGTGSYWSLGYSLFNFGPVYSELALGQQHIAFKGIGQMDTPDIMFGIGWSFL